MLNSVVTSVKRQVNPAAGKTLALKQLTFKIITVLSHLRVPISFWFVFQFGWPVLSSPQRVRVH